MSQAGRHDGAMPGAGSGGGSPGDADGSAWQDDPRQSLLRAARIQMRVIGALTLREMGSRFGRDNLGYLWLFAEPMLLGSAIGGIHLLSGHAMQGGINPMAFWTIGYIGYYLFRGIVNRAPSVVAGNQSLLYHRCVTLIDIVIARNLLEGAAVATVMVVFLVLFGALLGEWPVHPEAILFGLFLLLLLSHGLAMLIAAGSIKTDLFERVTHLFTYLSLPFVGCFVMVAWLPTQELRDLQLLVPTAHCFEMIRYGQYGTTVPTYFDPLYPIVWALCLNMLGMAALRATRRYLVV